VIRVATHYRGASRLALRAAPGASGPPDPRPRSAFALTGLSHPWHGPPVPAQSRVRAGLAGVHARHSPKPNSYHHHLSRVTS